MYKPELVLNNEIHKIHKDFDMQADHQNPASKPNLVLISKTHKKKITCWF